MARVCNLCGVPIASMFFWCACSEDDEYSVCPQCAYGGGQLLDVLGAGVLGAAKCAAPTCSGHAFCISYQMERSTLSRLVRDLETLLDDMGVLREVAAPTYFPGADDAHVFLCGDDGRLSCGDERLLQRSWTLSHALPALLRLPSDTTVRSVCIVAFAMMGLYS